MLGQIDVILHEMRNQFDQVPGVDRHDLGNTTNTYTNSYVNISIQIFT
jgi:hypothetical protein